MKPLFKLNINRIFLLFLIIFFYFSSGCQRHKTNSTTKDSTPSALIPVYTYKVINTYPHAINAFTQGLVFDDGFIYEGTGLLGRSTLRKVSLETGKVLKFKWLADNFFGEGITIYKNRIIQLTWKSHKGFVYDKKSFELIKEFKYPTEGWGITYDGEHLIMSDGTATLYFLDPENYEETGRIEIVSNEGRPVKGLNELEYVEGKIFANIWPTDQIGIIDLKDGKITGWIDLKGILNTQNYSHPVDVLNGIAYDNKNNRLFVTGKFWPKLFEIEILLKESSHIN